MQKKDLFFEFPEELIAKEPQRPSRICSAIEERPTELEWSAFLELFQARDVLVINDTKVLKRRVFSSQGLEILFLNSVDGLQWDVLFPSRKLKVGDVIELPNQVTVTLLAKGRPQKIKSSEPLKESYFDQFGELPLPPYIQKVRDDRHVQTADTDWYQTAWGARPGSFAAPTASLHFNDEHLRRLREKGVPIRTLTLHVGLGTFLPVEVEDLEKHAMHQEEVEIPAETLEAVKQARHAGGRIWAMGTTVTRALESQAAGKLPLLPGGGVYGKTDLLILPGFQFQVVDCLLTNFHQPESTLLALVMAFAGKEKVKKVYEWAIKNKFRLFSYGDLSVWKRG